MSGVRRGKMSKMLWKSLLFSPAILGVTLASGSLAIATENKANPEAVRSQAVVAQSSQEQTVAAATIEQELLQHIAPITPAAEKEAAPVATNAVKAEQEKASSKIQAPARAIATQQQKTLGDKSQAAPVAPNVTETTIAQAAPANSGSTLDQIIQYGSEGSVNSASEGQVTSVSQLRDVQPTDWAFQALQSLVERYGCIEGYPDRTYRGNRALTRYEFAAGLNACLDRIQELIAAIPQGGNTGGVTREDLATLQRLQEEFAAELATLRGRVDALEARTRRLEAQQFSTTTKLRGEVIFGLADVFGGGNFDVEGSNNTVFQDRVRLELQSSFTGKDILHTRLAAGNALAFNNFPGDGSFPGTGTTAEGTLNYFVGTTTNNDVVLDWLAYEFPLFGNSRVYIAATGGLHADYADVSNPYFYDGDGGNGGISAFSQQSPIYRIGGGAGAAISLGIGRGGSFFKPSSLTVGYLAGGSGTNRRGNSPFSANSPLDENGLFDGNYAALGQLNFNVSNRFGFALTYVHGYHNQGSDIFDAGGGVNGRVVGTSLANLPSRMMPGDQERPTITNSYGASAALRLSKNFSLSGWATRTDARVIGRGDAEIWSYGLGVAIPNFGREGNVLGLFAGAEPHVRSLEAPGPDPRFSRDIPWHIEGFYKLQLSDNISVTPGVIWLMSPNQSEDNDDIFIGTLRTTFTF